MARTTPVTSDEPLGQGTTPLPTIEASEATAGTLRRDLMPSKPDELWIYINGEFLPDSKAQISVMDHGLLYGDGCFDAWTGRNGFIFQLDAHLDRLLRSVRALKISLPMSREELRAIIVDCVHRNSLADFYIKVVVTRGISPEPVIDPSQCAAPSVIVYARPVPVTEVTDDKRRVGSRLKVLAMRRTSHESLEPKVKSLNYLNIVMGRLEAQASGFDEGVLLDAQGFVCECTGFNILAINGDRLLAPKNDALMGITRDSVIQMARAEGMEVEEGLYTVYDFVTADEVLLSNTVSGVASVVNIDGWAIGSGVPGPRGLRFAETYRRWLATGRLGIQVFPEAWRNE
jgi:branched-chain amino acid aminotransferase